MANERQRGAILLHNAGGCKEFLRPQAQALEDAGYKLLCLDLPGHGQSPEMDQFHVDELAEYVWGRADNQGLVRPFILGLNYGACVGVEMAAQRPEDCSHLVLLDPPLLMESWVKSKVEDHIAELHNPNVDQFAEKLVEDVLVRGSDEDREMAIESFNRVRTHTLASLYEGLIEWDKQAEKRLSKCSMPLLHIQSEKPFCEELALKDVCTQTQTRRLAGTGPWVSLEAPTQVNVLVHDFLEEGVQ